MKHPQRNKKTSSISPDQDVLMQFFGYNRERFPNESPFSFSEEGLVCMVSTVDSQSLDSIMEISGRKFKIGDYFISKGGCNDVAIYGPFSQFQEACDFAQKEFGAIRFISMPYFDHLS